MKFPEILTVGGVISGYCATGNVVIAISPTNTITIDITIAVTGRFIKVSAIIVKSPYKVFRSYLIFLAHWNQFLSLLPPLNSAHPAPQLFLLPANYLLQ